SALPPRPSQPRPARRRFVLGAASLAAASLAPRRSRAQPGAGRKVVRMGLRAAETGFDPVLAYDRYSVGVCENLFETLITYDYLARPPRLVPLAAEAVPEPEEGGTRYTFRIKPGIYFNDDPAFQGKRRELVAEDMAYAIKRFRDPRNRSAYAWLFEHNIVGLDELAQRAKKEGKFDYDAKVAGIEVRGKYAISFKL